MPAPHNLWSVREHLLLAANAFSLLVKAQLARRGYCCLTEEDQVEIDVFEQRACKGPFGKEDGDWTWSRVKADEAFRRATAKSAKKRLGG